MLFLTSNHRSVQFLYLAASMEIDVASVLSAAEKNAKEKFKSTEVTKDIDPDLDIGNLLATDLQPIDLREIR